MLPSYSFLLLSCLPSLCLSHISPLYICRKVNIVIRSSITRFFDRSFFCQVFVSFRFLSFHYPIQPCLFRFVSFRNDSYTHIFLNPSHPIALVPGVIFSYFHILISSFHHILSRPKIQYRMCGVRFQSQSQSQSQP